MVDSSQQEQEEFVPQKINIKPTSRQGRRRGDDKGGGGGETSNAGSDTEQTNTHQLNASHHAQAEAISSSVVFHEDVELFDELDDLYPHDYEGGKIVTDPHSSTATNSTIASGRPRSDSNLSVTRSLASSLLQSLQNSSLGGSGHRIPTDYESLIASTNDGTLAEMIAGIEDRYKASTTLSQASLQGSDNEVVSGRSNKNAGSKRESVVGGKPVSEMSFEERRELLAPERSKGSLLVDFKGKDGLITPSELSDQGCTPLEEDVNIVSSVDWSSLSKSCKRAKNAFRDADSGQMVVRNMFMTHLQPLAAVLTLYARRYCRNEPNPPCPLEEIKARTTETKRALRFAMACLSPPRVEGEDGTAGGKEPSPTNGPADTQGDVEKYRTVRGYRQELQETAVRGLISRSSSPTDDAGERAESGCRYGLHIPLVEIIHDSCSHQLSGDDSGLPTAASSSADSRNAALSSSIEREKQIVRVLAARLLCNIVTDNPLAAEIVLRDIPWSPPEDIMQMRMAKPVLGSRERVDGAITSNGDDATVFWSDLVTASAKVQGSGGASKSSGSDDREVLAAVAAALHNLLTSLEARESLLELDDEMKRRETAKQRRAVSRNDSLLDNPDIVEENEVVQQSAKPIDVGFEVASDGVLLNALLRNILPAKAVLMQSKMERERTEPTGPNFKSPASSGAEDMSDSATEWISLVLERLASRGLLPNMLRSAGGSKPGYVTPEEVVLVSCIRQAVDDYHMALTPTGETGEFGRRRLSVAAKSVGVTVSTRPHPLWGRADPCAGGMAATARDSRTAVPVLLSIANEAEEMRNRASSLREDKTDALYDGEEICTIRIIDDLCDILAQCLGRHAEASVIGIESLRNKQCFIADARSVLGRETALISSCCKDLGRILDIALASNAGRKARELKLSAQDQQTAIVMVRLIGNIIYRCRYNQDLLRILQIPVIESAVGAPAKSSPPVVRTALHVILSATSLAPACFTLREWCIVAIRNAVEDNAANAETVRRLEANQVVDDTPELRSLGVKIELDEKGNVQVKRRDA